MNKTFSAFRVGVFIVIALVCLSVGIFLIGSKDMLFGSRYVLKAEFANVQGLNQGADVRVGGIHQGTVKEIDLPPQPDGKVTVVMALRDNTRNLIKQDSVASIKTEGLLGDKYVEVSFGSMKSESVRAGDTIRSQIPTDMSEQANALAVEAQRGIAAFRDDMEALQHNFLLRGFFEKRGYNDARELTRHSIAYVPENKRSKTFEYEADKLFDKSDNAKLKNKKELDDAGKFLEGNPFGLAVIASSEAKGDTNKDHVLSEARAAVVRDYLTRNFKVDDKRIRTIGLGKTAENGESDSSKIYIYIYPRTG